MHLTTDLKTHILIYRRKEKEPLKLTTQEVKVISEFLKSSEGFLDLMDENGNIVEIINRYEISTVEKLRSHGGSQVFHYRCEWGNRHVVIPNDHSCTCNERFFSGKAGSVQVKNFYLRNLGLPYITIPHLKLRHVEQAIEHFTGKKKKIKADTNGGYTHA